MGKFLSKDIIHTVDVSGDHSYVVVLNGVPMNLSAILYNITETVIKENQKIMIYTIMIAIMITMILTLLIVSILFSYYMKYYQEYVELCMERIHHHHQNKTTKINRGAISTIES